MSTTTIFFRRHKHNFYVNLNFHSNLVAEARYIKYLSNSLISIEGISTKDLILRSET